MALVDGVDTFIVMSDDAVTIQLLGEGVAPVRERVAAARDAGASVVWSTACATPWPMRGAACTRRRRDRSWIR
jgi:hypothetical protein